MSRKTALAIKTAYVSAALVVGFLYTSGHASAAVRSVTSSGVWKPTVVADGLDRQVLQLIIDSTDPQAIDQVSIAINKPRTFPNDARGYFQWAKLAGTPAESGSFHSVGGQFYGQQFVQLITSGDLSVVNINTTTGKFYAKFKWNALPSYGYTGANTISYYVHETNGSTSGWRTLTGTGSTFRVVSATQQTQPSLTVTWGTMPVAQTVVSHAQNVMVGTLNLTASATEDVRVSSVHIRVDDAAVLNSASAANTTFSNLKLVGPGGVQYGTTMNLTDAAPDDVNVQNISNLIISAGQTVQVSVRVNIDSSNAGPWYFGTAATTDVVATGVVSGSAATVFGTGVSSAVTVVGSGQLTLVKDASSPLTSLVAVGSNGSSQEVPLLAIRADATHEDVDLTMIKFLYVPELGDNAQTAFAPSLSLYAKKNNGSEVLVGLASLVSPANNGSAAEVTFRFAPGRTVRLSQNDTNILILKAVFNGTSNGTSPASSPFIQLGDGTHVDTDFVTAQGVSSQAQLTEDAINGANRLNILGEQKVLYASFPIFSEVNQSISGDHSLVNGIQQNVYSFRAAGQYLAVSLKQLAFDVDVVDSIGSDNTIALGGFKLFRDGFDITNMVSIQTGAGLNLKTNGPVLGEGTGQTVYITWTGANEEMLFPSGGSVYTLKATPTGFVTDADNDYVRIRLANHQATSGELSHISPTNFLTSATPVSSLISLSNQDQRTSLTSIPDIIWSDMSAFSSHNAAVGNSVGMSPSSGDWFDGYYVTNTPTNYTTLMF